MIFVFGILPCDFNRVNQVQNDEDLTPSVDPKKPAIDGGILFSSNFRMKGEEVSGKVSSDPGKSSPGDDSDNKDSAGDKSVVGTEKSMFSCLEWVVLVLNNSGGPDQDEERGDEVNRSKDNVVPEVGVNRDAGVDNLIYGENGGDDGEISDIGDWGGLQVDELEVEGDVRGI